MISSLHGRVTQLRLDRLELSVNGVGYRILATPATLAPLRVGEEAQLATSLVVREDSLTLYGFADHGELEVFEVLQTVSGVGPRLALALLAVLSPEQLRAAVEGEDLATLKRVPGIGHKGAQRLALELAGKLNFISAAPEAPEQLPVVALVNHDQVLAGLVGLGWSEKLAQQAIDRALAADESLAEQPAPVVLRAALQVLSGVSGRG